MPRIGITGHTNLTAATAQAVYEALRNILLLHPSRELVGVSCLARGADQIFAQAVLDLGGALRVVLPAPDYRSKIKPDNTACYDALVDAAESVHVMPFEISRRVLYGCQRARAGHRRRDHRRVGRRSVGRVGWYR